MLETRPNAREWRNKQNGNLLKILLPISQFYATRWLLVVCQKADFDYWKIYFHSIANDFPLDNISGGSLCVRWWWIYRQSWTRKSFFLIFGRTIEFFLCLFHSLGRRNKKKLRYKEKFKMAACNSIKIDFFLVLVKV